MKKTFLILPLLLLVLSIAGCSDGDLLKQDLQEKFSGKWRHVETICVGSTVSAGPDGWVIEFHSNGKVRWYDDSGGYRESFVYWVTQDFLYQKAIHEGKVIDDGWIYEYVFFGDSLKLTIVHGLVTNRGGYIYKKEL